jgi:hypothetical protein
MLTILESASRSLMTTDGASFGSEPGGLGLLATLRDDVTSAVSDAYWTFMLQGELEDAFDSALMRAALSETPVLSGPLTVWAI